jgi:hypothetical protein
MTDGSIMMKKPFDICLTLSYFVQELSKQLSSTKPVFTAACHCPTSTEVLLPGFFAMKLSANSTITQAQLCPKGYFCPGGVPNSTFDPSNSAVLSPNESSIKDCGAGMSTREVGASAAQQCGESRGAGTCQGLHMQLLQPSR